MYVRIVSKLTTITCGVLLLYATDHLPILYQLQERIIIQDQPADSSLKYVLSFFEIDSTDFENYEIVTRRTRSTSETIRDTSLNIWALNLETEELQQKTFDGGYWSPLISPDSQTIWFVRQGEIWKRSPERSVFERIFAGEGDVRLLLGWSRANPELLLFLREPKMETVYELNIKTKEIKELRFKAETIDKLIEYSRTNTKRLVFDDVYEKEWDILLRHRGSPYNQQLTNDGYIDRDPSWLDEKTILFVSDRKGLR